MEAFDQLLQIQLKKQLPLTITTGVVKAIEGNVCQVVREGLPTLFKVRLNAVQSPLKHYIIITPKQGSVVQCGLIENDPARAFIISTSEIEKLEIGFEDNLFKLDPSGVNINLNNGSFNVGVNGSTFKVDDSGASMDLEDGKIDIKNSSEDLKVLLSDILDTITQLTVTTPNGPSGPPINATAFSAIKTRLSNLFN